MKQTIPNHRCSPFVLALIIIIIFFLETSAHGIRLTHVKHLFDLTGQLDQPSDVAVSKDGRIYVVDGVNNKIRLYGRDGKLVSSFGKKGSGKGEFHFPLGIDIDGSGKIYVADSGNHRIQIFNPEGKFIALIKLPSTKNHPADPTDVAVDENRKRCYVVDNDNHRILVYDLATRKMSQTYGTPGTGKLAFRYPFLMALDKENYLYIVDVINTRVQVLNPDGLFVNFLGGWGVEKGEFFRPKGVAIGKDSRVFVSDSYLGVIQIFDSATGEFHAAVGDPEKGAVKKFKSPVGLFIDHRSHRWACS